VLQTGGALEPVSLEEQDCARLDPAVGMHNPRASAFTSSRADSESRHGRQGHIEQLETAVAVGQCVAGLLDQREYAQELARLIEAHFAYEQTHIFTWSAATRRLSRLPSDPDAAQPTEIPLARSGPLGEVLEGGAPVLFDAYRGTLDPADPESREIGSRAMLPIHFRGQVVGVLDLRSQRYTYHAPVELIGLQSLADQVGVALHNCELYAEALRAREQAEGADRVKTRLLANVSHELRAPLNVILGYSQAALALPNSNGIDVPAALRRDLEHIYASGNHLIRLINDLLDLSRAEVDALDLFPELIAPGAFLEGVFQQASGHAASRPGVTWRLAVAPRLPLLQADPVRLRQVLDNLLNNARESTTNGEIVLGADVEGQQLHVWVRDTGEGIPADQRERVFEPFVSGGGHDGRRKGIGLGLTITRRLVTLHGGTLVVESDLGRGSTFHVRMPLPRDQKLAPGNVSVLAKPAARQAVLGAIEGLQPAQPTGTVLIVDDDPSACTFYSRLVSQALPLCTTRTASNGAEALRILEEQHEPPALVILDVVMPEVDGFAVLERLRTDRRTRHVPALVVSGRLLSLEDLQRLDHARVLYQTKDLLTPAEASGVLQGVAAGHAVLPQATSAVVKRALVYLHEQYGRSLARHDVALAVGVSESYLSQIFHRELGLSPWDYLSRLRIHMAKELLSSTRESITTVAGRVGFEDAAYFSRVFHKLVGESPHTYRQLR
jgi:signal transduction histidine kinase/AraC-like DNA-binding protein